MILASRSPRRIELLGSLGLKFSLYFPDIDESQADGESPLDYVKRMAEEKAFEGGLRRMFCGDLAIPDQWAYTVIAADTIVIAPDGQTILGKPYDEGEASATLRLLRGKIHTVCTAIQVEWFSPRVLGHYDLEQASEVVQTRVTMRYYTDEEIAAYVATGDPFDKAGGYAIQHAAFNPVARIDGCYSNVVGLPLCAVKRCLHQLRLSDDQNPLLRASEVCNCQPFGSLP